MRATLRKETTPSLAFPRQRQGIQLQDLVPGEGTSAGERGGVAAGGNGGAKAAAAAPGAAEGDVIGGLSERLSGVLPTFDGGVSAAHARWTMLEDRYLECFRRLSELESQLVAAANASERKVGEEEAKPEAGGEAVYDRQRRSKRLRDECRNYRYV